ncbi:MAG: hypothetical protein H7Z19_13010 [Chitinophagaceae bacterium]|nr:hypothetical protein [Rubrivivax sp.]
MLGRLVRGSCSACSNSTRAVGQACSSQLLPGGKAWLSPPRSHRSSACWPGRRSVNHTSPSFTTSQRGRSEAGRVCAASAPKVDDHGAAG